MAKKCQLNFEIITEIKSKLEFLPQKSRARFEVMKTYAKLFHASISTIYRQVYPRSKIKNTKRSDNGKSRKMDNELLENYCEIIAATKIKTKNKKGRHTSTTEAIRLLEDTVMQNKDEVIKLEKGLLKASTINRHLKRLELDARSLSYQIPATRFQAEYSNQLWQFDLSYSDLKSVEELPDWIDEKLGRPVLMIYSVVDDRSGVSYQEYRIVYGEDIMAALTFLYNAMAPKNRDDFPFQGIPDAIYTDNGSISKSDVFKRVMSLIGVEILKHKPNSENKKKANCRAKGKVERPFRSIKEIHETLYHFNKPKNEEEANKWMLPYLIRYGQMLHRSGKLTRFEDWIEHIPASGIRKICPLERYYSFAREPIIRKVAKDLSVSVSNIRYQVDEELIDRQVCIWFGLFDQNIFVEYDGKTYGPFPPIDGPIPLYKYRSFKKTEREKKLERIEDIANNLSISRDKMENIHMKSIKNIKYDITSIRMRNFDDPDPFAELKFKTPNQAKKFIAEKLGIPLPKLPESDFAYINNILNETLEKAKIIEAINFLKDKKNELSLKRKEN